jgi:hypothetical protein
MLAEKDIYPFATHIASAPDMLLCGPRGSGKKTWMHGLVQAHARHVLHNPDYMLQCRQRQQEVKDQNRKYAAVWHESDWHYDIDVDDMSLQDRHILAPLLSLLTSTPDVRGIPKIVCLWHADHLSDEARLHLRAAMHRCQGYVRFLLTAERLAPLVQLRHLFLPLRMHAPESKPQRRGRPKKTTTKTAVTAASSLSTLDGSIVLGKVFAATQAWPIDEFYKGVWRRYAVGGWDTLYWIRDRIHRYMELHIQPSDMLDGLLLAFVDTIEELGITQEQQDRIIHLLSKTTCGEAFRPFLWYERVWVSLFCAFKGYDQMPDAMC